ncbi:AsmA-like C-terminal region-containing protein [Crocinitomix algicola]|uniref:AsmA-like C-terminal region-containing protein n=1 Tax=Crocinitomix algicola TaxID=1740263 RepID=UPI0008363B56|nr:AsmA-like C-terminal region-containing protein [Crocinitomix algicola]
MNGLRKLWKGFKKLVFWLFFIGLFFITVITVILHLYQDDIEAYAIAELNNHLTTKVEVRNMEVSMFYDFPYTSLGFQGVLIKDAFTEVNSEDTMLYADELYFHFNLLDIWRGNYKVKSASIHNGQVNLKTTNTGDVNYGIIEPNNDSVDTDENFQFLLDKLQVENMNFGLVNRSTNQDYQILIKKGTAKGDFAASKYELEADADLFIKRLKSGSLSLITDKSANLNAAMDIDIEALSYKFKKGDLKVDEMQFQVLGDIDSNKIDLNINGQNIQVGQVVNSVFPADKLNNRAYIGEGLVDFKGEISGPISRTEMPSIEADFAVKNGAILESESKLKVHSINLIGSYMNSYKDRMESLTFDSFELKLLRSYLKGTGKIENFVQPTFMTNAQGDVDLAAFNQFFGFDGVDKLKGQVRFNLSCLMKFFDPEYRKDKFQILSSNGHISMENVVFKGNESDLHFTNITGELFVKEKDAAAKDLKIKTLHSDLTLNGAMKNIVGYVDGSSNLGLIASVEANHILLDEFLGTPNKEKDGPLSMFELPADLNLNVELDIGQLNWENHQFDKISGQFLLANRKATVNQIQLSTLGGNVRGKLSLNNLLENGNIIDGKLTYTDINVKKLFKEWDNFKQTSITSEHLSGRVNGSVDILLLFNPYFSIVEEQIIAVSDIKIMDGALTNLETMRAITDYMRSNKGLKLMLNKHIDKFEDKLMNLRFSELHNRIEIKDRKITIPKMTISTNALDVNLFGWHDFDNNIEYHFSFRFRDLKSKPTTTEFGTIEDDGLGLIVYLTMSGSIEDPTFSLDKQERKNEIKANIANEKESMKSMLKTEFGLFERDTTIKKHQKDNKKEVEFIFYDDDVEEDSSDESKKKKKNKSRVGKFIDNLKQEDKEDNEDIQFVPE